MLTDTTRDLIFKIATGNYTNDELTTFLEAIKNMDKASFMEAYQLLYAEVDKYPAEPMAPDFKDQKLERRLVFVGGPKGFSIRKLSIGAPRHTITIMKRKNGGIQCRCCRALIFRGGVFFIE